MSAEGMTLALISQETGLGESKLKMILSRHPTLGEMPYSVKAGGARVFFPAFVEWLKEYEGIESHESHKPVTSVTRLPAGIQLREIRLLAEKGVLTRDDVRRLLGLSIAQQAPALPAPEDRASDEVGEAAFASIQAAIGAKGAMQIAGAVGRIVGDAVAKKEADRKQGRLL